MNLQRLARYSIAVPISVFFVYDITLRMGNDFVGAQSVTEVFTFPHIAGWIGELTLANGLLIGIQRFTVQGAKDIFARSTGGVPSSKKDPALDPARDAAEKYVCSDCRKHFPRYLVSINLKEAKEEQSCPYCGSVQLTRVIQIEEAGPKTYDLAEMM